MFKSKKEYQFTKTDKKFKNDNDMNTISVTSNSKILSYIVETPIKDKDNKNYTFSLNKNNKEEMKKIFGKQSEVADYEFREWIWGFKLSNNKNIYVLCSNKGTSYETDLTYEEINKKENEKEIIEFLENLYMKFKELKQKVEQREKIIEEVSICPPYFP